MVKISSKAAPIRAQKGAAAGQPTTLAASAASASTEKNYLGRQQDLYLYARRGWQYYAEHQAMFEAFSPSYTRELGVQQLQFIDETEAMPDQEARMVEPLEAKDDLWELNLAVLDKFGDAKIYIERTWREPKKQETMLNAAGYGYFKAAAERNWTSSNSLITALKSFLTTYGQQMVEALQMPATFPSEFSTVSEPFLTLWNSYKDKWSEARQGRASKAENNNEIYRVLSEMCEVGKRKAPDEEVYQKFVLTLLLDEVRGNSPSGVRGLVTVGGDRRQPVANARISVLGDAERFATSDGTGRYELPLPSGNYVLLVEAEGFLPLRISKTVKIGVKSYVNPALEALSAAPSIEAQPPIDVISAAVESMAV